MKQHKDQTKPESGILRSSRRRFDDLAALKRSGDDVIASEVEQLQPRAKQQCSSAVTRLWGDLVSGLAFGSEQNLGSLYAMAPSIYRAFLTIR